MGSFSSSGILLIGAALVLLTCASAPAADERRGPLVLFDFEDLAEATTLKTDSEQVILDVVQDYGVTRGSNCLRWVGKMGDPWSTVVIAAPEKLSDFESYQYFAMDCYNGGEQPAIIMLEFWDVDSKDFHSRCTQEEKIIHPGVNRLFWRMDRLKRNGKEGSGWDEIEAKDKIRLADLTKIKLITVPAKAGGDTKLWVDNIRLLPEGSVDSPMAITLPEGSIAYKFGSKSFSQDGFTTIGAPESERRAIASAGEIVGSDVREMGDSWPDALTGNGLVSTGSGFSFRANIPTGEYMVWISAGRIYDPTLPTASFLLKVGDNSLVEETLSEREFFGEKGVFRYIRTQYSERPNALWMDYAEPEAQVFTCKVAVADDPLIISVSGMRLSAMALVPARNADEFSEMCESIRAERIKAFNSKTFIGKQDKPRKPNGADAFTVWSPASYEKTRPWSDPGRDGTSEFRWVGAQGQRIAQRICVTPWQDLGVGDIVVSDFSGPGVIPASSVRMYYMNYRYRDGSVDEMTLLPWTKIRFENGITWAYWAWIKIPDDAVPGTYQANMVFSTEKSGRKEIPLTLTVYPFRLTENIPIAHGMYYRPWSFIPGEPPDGFVTARDFLVNMTRRQFDFMRELGLTTVSLPSPSVENGQLQTGSVQSFWAAAKEAGFGRDPERPIMATQLGLARRIGRELWNSVDAGMYDMGYVDRNPGIELELPAFRDAYLSVMRQYKRWLDQQGMAVAMEVVDEPREVPNPWNRNRDAVIQYAKWLEDIGVHTFVTLMGDENMGKDYTPIVEHIDIVSVHAGTSSAKTIRRARELGKSVWFYNIGMDRYSWGFFSWANDARARWQWHFCFPEGKGVFGHPNPSSWYSPFTRQTGYAMHAPYFDMVGGMTFRSDFFGMADGITDCAYVYSLQEAIAKNSDKESKRESVERARKLLSEIQKEIPPYTDSHKGISDESGALAGSGIKTPLVAKIDSWRHSIAESIIDLMKP